MNSLLKNRFAPITFACAYFEAPLDLVCAAIVKWRKEHQTGVKTESIEAPLAIALHSLEPLTTLRRRELLISTVSSWTAYFDNSARGGDPFGTASHLALVMQCRSVVVQCVPHTLSSGRQEAVGTLGAVTFELFMPEQREWLNYQRAVAVGNDGYRWFFREEGTPLPFEQVERYGAKKIEDRFTPEMLETYCMALGIQLFNENFYGPQAILVTITDPLPDGHKAISLNDAKLSLGLLSSEL